MDFLDPRKRRHYNIRLIVGYVLVAIVIGLGTVILVYGANGYGINTKTGQIIQNGLLFVDSQPGGADIYLNGSSKNTTTSARLILPAGKYTLTLKKSGYRNWTSTFVLNEQSIARYVYPFLFPVKPVAANLKAYATAPGLVTESPDRHWLLAQANESSAKTAVFDEYDTSTLDQTTPDVRTVSIPEGLLTDYSAASKLAVTEWSTDNNNVLLQHIYGGGSEFVVFNRDKPDQSFNVNRMFNINPTKVSLRDKSADQLYIFSQDGGVLQLGDTGKKQLAQPLLKHVLAYKPYGKDLLTYVTDNNEPAGKVAARIWNNGQTYKLNEFSAGSAYLIDAAQNQGHWYYVASSDTADRVNIYKDPLDSLKNPALGKALPLLSLHDSGANELSFSDNARFIEVENGQRFAVYDIDTGNSYQYTLSDTLAGDMVWMDGHRLIGLSGGNVFVMDYDGTNKQALTPSAEVFGGLFSRDYNHMLAVAPAADGSGSFTLQDVDMRAGSDLPKK